MPPKREREDDHADGNFKSWKQCMWELEGTESKLDYGEQGQVLAGVKSAMECLVHVQERVRTFVECVEAYSSLMEGTRSSETETPEMRRMVDSMLEVKKAVGINGPLDEFEEAVRRENDESDDDDEDDDEEEEEKEKEEDSEDDEEDESDVEEEVEEEVEEVEDEDDEDDEEEVVVIEIKDDEEEEKKG